MIFTCDTNLLNNALTIVSHAVSIRSPKSILEGIYMKADKEGLKLVSTDESMSIDTLIPATVEREGSVVLPGRLLCDIVRKIPEPTCSFNVSDRFQALITSGFFRTNLTGLDPDEYPNAQKVTGIPVEIPQKLLKDMVQKTIFSIATDNSRPILTGVLLEVGVHDIRTVALDGFRLALRHEVLESPSREMKAVVPGKTMGDVIKILEDNDDPVEITVDKGRIQFQIGNTHVTSSLLEGEYIRYNTILPTEWATKCEIGKREMESAVDRASLIAKLGKNKLVSFGVHGDVLRMTSISENSDMEEKLDVMTEGKDIVISFNVEYINEVLKAIPDERITMRFNSNVSPCLFVPEKGDSYIYMVLPVRTAGQGR